MSVPQVILLSLAVPLFLASMVLGMTLPMLKATELWAGIPREVLRQHRFRWWWLRPSVWWVAFCVCGVVEDVLHWTQQPQLHLAFRAGGGLLAVVGAVLSVVWAARILAQRQTVPSPLYGFAVLAACFGLVAVGLGAWECYAAMHAI